MSLPYMGSKRGSANKIYHAIKELNPEANILCDLFCGGFAISSEFIKKGWQIIANDKNKYVIAVIKKAIEGGFNDSVFTPEFISREKFLNTLNNPQSHENWYVGYLMCCWSFGNNQRGYLFGQNVEKYKKAGHELVISKNPEPIKKLFPQIPQKYIHGILKQSDWHKARIALRKVSTALKTRVLELQQLERLERLQQLEQLEQLERLERLQQLERLERLEQLEQLQQLQQLELYSGDYGDVKIPERAVIYCDPPYRDTAEYSEGGFNHSEFWGWVREKSKNHNVYVSEYQAPADFKKVLEFSRNATLGSGQNKNQPNECLFTIKI